MSDTGKGSGMTAKEEREWFRDVLESLRWAKVHADVAVEKLCALRDAIDEEGLMEEKLCEPAKKVRAEVGELVERFQQLVDSYDGPGGEGVAE